MQFNIYGYILLATVVFEVFCDEGPNFNEATSQGLKESGVRSLKRTKRNFGNIFDIFRRNSAESSSSSSSFGTTFKPKTANHSWTGNITRSSYVLHDSGGLQNGPISTFNYRHESGSPSDTSSSGFDTGFGRQENGLQLEPTITYVSPKFNPETITFIRRGVSPTDGKIHWTSERVSRNGSVPDWMTQLINRSKSQSTTGIVSSTEAPTGGCVLPEQPIGGSYKVLGCAEPCNLVSGSKVPVGSILSYSCGDTYTLRGYNTSVCSMNNMWHVLPTCAKTCRPLKSASVDVICRYYGEIVSCQSNIIPNTKATMACKHSYKIPFTNDPVYREIRCTEGGFWDNELLRCIPECGTKLSRGVPLIVNGFAAKHGSFPWHVGIYETQLNGSRDQICGGSLISPRLVISAAHCFYDDSTATTRNASNFTVAAGKYYRAYNWPERFVQQSPVKQIALTSRYSGVSGNYVEDIALIRVWTPFNLTSFVRPVCIDWENTFESEHLQEGRVGKVSGWGKTADGNPSFELQEINVPYVPFETCISAVPRDFRGYITPDKFCAGYTNGSSLCNGDSGGGLVFQINNLWYLRGIVSVSPVKQGMCDNRSYTGFTNVGNFREWIREFFRNPYPNGVYI